ncbi:hypothetical protein OROGR_032499 [Orobanche gracilis]
MDKTWMSLNRLSPKYENGVEAFLKFALKNATNVDIIRAHLVVNGPDLTYTKWIWHGEYYTSVQPTHDGNGCDTECSVEQPMNMIHDAYDSLDNNPNQFQKLLEDAEKPLYCGCKGFTKLSATLKLFNLKARYGWSDTSFDDLLHLLGEMLPDPNEMPSSSYEAKKSIRTLGEMLPGPNEMPSSSYFRGKQVLLKIKPTNLIVAHGTVVVAGPLIHGAPMPKDTIRVSIDEALDENAPIPFPISDDMSTVGSALATHVAWPRELVSLKDEKHAKKKNEKRPPKEKMVKSYSSLPITMKALYCILQPRFNSGQGLHVQLDTAVFGYDINVWILREDFISFCDLEPITGNCIVGYIWHLYKSLQEHEASDKFVFVSPFGISHGVKISHDERTRKLTDMLVVATENQLVLVPCDIGLCIFDGPYRIRDSTWKYVVDTAMTIFNATKGPIQPDSKQCGFYVMRFMKEIVKAFKNDGLVIDSIHQQFHSTRYSEGEIDEVRADWATTMINEIDM